MTLNEILVLVTLMLVVLTMQSTGQSRRVLPSSSRDLVCLSICNAENIIPSDPLSWNKDFVNGVCKSCPKNLPINVAPELGKVEIKFSW